MRSALSKWLKNNKRELEKNKMMRLTTLFYLSVLILNFIACKSNKDASEQSVASEQSQSADIVPTSENDLDHTNQWPDESKEQYNRVIKGVADSLFFKIERTSCFGRCPTYEISVFESGYVIYHGKRNVDKIGFYESRLSNEQLKLILERAKAIDYFQLNDRYDGNMTDVPSTITLIQYNDDIKAVIDRVNGPQALKQFQREMDELLLKLDYTVKEVY